MGTNNGGKIMNRLLSFFMCLLLVLSGCSADKTEEEIALNKLQTLSDEGYNVMELSLRLNCPTEDVVSILQGKEKIDPTLFQQIDSVYSLNDDEKIIPVNKLGKSATECLWQIYTKAQNLPLTAQYTNVGVSSVGNALTRRRTLGYNDSIKVLVAYINNVNELDTIPTHINIASYYYNDNEGIKNIKVPRDYSLLYKDATEEQLVKLSFFIWQAEQFELKANANLEKSINGKISNYVTSSIANFANEDIDSYWNSVKCLFKDSAEIRNFYYKKLKKRFNERQLQSSIQEEIASYCVSINCSRILAVNEVLGYDENVNNLSIAQKEVLKKTMSRMEGLQIALNLKKAELGRESLVNGIVLLPIIVQPEVGASIKGASSIAKSLSIVFTKNLCTDILAYIGFESIYGQLYKVCTGKELDSKTAIRKVQKNMEKELNYKLNNQVNKVNGYKYLLDQNTKLYYSNLRKDLGL